VELLRRPVYLFYVTAKCPTCGRVLDGAPTERPYRPFCSERCRSADLGSWLSAAYRITAPVAEEDLDQGSPAQHSSDAPDSDDPAN
jgi:endogenous inhibitor of DNA gyrase (YacG/DUF329 family)